jgi:hypothetical protein
LHGVFDFGNRGRDTAKAGLRKVCGNDWAELKMLAKYLAEHVEVALSKKPGRRLCRIM